MKYLLILLFSFCSSVSFSQKEKVYEILQPYFKSFPLKADLDSINKFLATSTEFSLDSVYDNGTGFIKYDTGLDFSSLFGSAKVEKINFEIYGGTSMDSIKNKIDTMVRLMLTFYFNRKVNLKKEAVSVQKKLSKLLHQTKIEREWGNKLFHKVYRYYYEKKDITYFVSVGHYIDIIEERTIFFISIFNTTNYSRSPKGYYRKSL